MSVFKSLTDTAFRHLFLCKWSKVGNFLLESLRQLDQQVCIISLEKYMALDNGINYVHYKSTRVRLELRILMNLYQDEGCTNSAKKHQAAYIILALSRHPLSLSSTNIRLLHKDLDNDCITWNNETLSRVFTLFEIHRVFAKGFLLQLVQSKSSTDNLTTIALWRHIYRLHKFGVNLDGVALAKIIDSTVEKVSSSSIDTILQCITVTANNFSGLNNAEKTLREAFSELLQKEKSISFTQCIDTLRVLRIDALKNSTACKKIIDCFLSQADSVTSENVLPVCEILKKLPDSYRNYQKKFIEKVGKRDLISQCSSSLLLSVLFKNRGLLLGSDFSKTCFQTLFRIKKEFCPKTRLMAVRSCLSYRSTTESKPLAHYLLNTMESQSNWNHFLQNAENISDAINLMSLYPLGGKRIYEKIFEDTKEIALPSDVIIRLLVLYERYCKESNNYKTTLVNKLLKKKRDLQLTELCEIVNCLSPTYSKEKQNFGESLISQLIKRPFSPVEWIATLQVCSKHAIYLLHYEDVVTTQLQTNLKKFSRLNLASILQWLLKLKCSNQALLHTLWRTYFSSLIEHLGAAYFKMLPHMLVERQIWMPECPLESTEQSNLERIVSSPFFTNLSLQERLRIAFCLCQLGFVELSLILRILQIDLTLGLAVQTPRERKLTPLLFFVLCTVHKSCFFDPEAKFYRKNLSKWIQDLAQTLSQCMPNSRYEYIHVVRGLVEYISLPHDNSLPCLQYAVLEGLEGINLSPLKNLARIRVLWDISFLDKDVIYSCKAAHVNLAKFAQNIRDHLPTDCHFSNNQFHIAARSLNI